MLIADELELRAGAIAASADLTGLSQRLLTRARQVQRRNPAIPELKGMLTADGGVCPEDGSALLFDPWSPQTHRCPRCQRAWQGERHDRRWAWHMHLWLAERMAEAASVGVLAGEDALTGWSVTLLEQYAERYLDFPNSDNVLGPSRLFSSTYLESIWLTGYLSAGFIMREANLLTEPALDAVSRVAEEAANLIGEFDEGLSNRQTWHNAALAAAAVWFGDEDLAQRAISGSHGLVAHLVDGFRPDGLWYEGENYHLFALRGLLLGSQWARLAGIDLFEAEAARDRLAAALLAPALTALPDGSFPARKDSRFGVSLAQPMYLELWEAGVAIQLEQGRPELAGQLAGWLRHLYQLPAPAAQTFDSYLHEAGEARLEGRDRTSLSWWMLWTMAPELPAGVPPWRPGSVLLEDQGLAILRGADHYASLEAGIYGGGHGHADRLHVTLHAGGEHWLADPGTGSYVSRDLFWYRSTLAHNAPRLDGASQPIGDARVEAFAEQGDWAWVRGGFGGFTRTLVAGPGHLVDVVEFADENARQVELPWHPAGDLQLLTPGRWEPAELADAFVSRVERFTPGTPGVIHARAGSLVLLFDGAGELLRATGPGRPGDPAPHQFLVRRQSGRFVRLVSALRWDGAPLAAGSAGLSITGSEITVQTAAGPVIHRQTAEGWEIQRDGVRTPLKGLRRELIRVKLDVPTPGSQFFRATPPGAIAVHLAEPPSLDAGTDGFDGAEPIVLDHEDQYRRSEEPFPGPDALAATAWLGWDASALWLTLRVTKSEPLFPDPGAAPLRLDNEPELIHADGIQLYMQLPGGSPAGWLVVPDPTGSAVRVQAVAGTAGAAEQVRGSWQATDDGYALTLAVSLPGWPPAPADGPIGFDLLINEMRPDRLRRAGQLVWSGGGGWIYLRGDRQDPSRFGRLELA